MLSLITSIMGILITILLVIGIHEFGHFIVAKLLGVKVLRFSIGFGKALKTWHDKKGTEYALAVIPLGGYVKMLDEGEGPVSAQDLPYAYNRQPYLKKLAIIAAGPLSNLIFAFFVYWILFRVGFLTIAPVIGAVTPNSIAAAAGIKPQQEILQIDDALVTNWSTAVIHLISRSGDTGTLVLHTRDLDSHDLKTYTLNLSQWRMDDLKPDPLLSLGIAPYEPEIPAIIGTIQADSPASKSNLLIGDKITAINGHAVKDWYALTEELAGHTSETLMFTIVRQNKILSLPVTVGEQGLFFLKKRAYLGISPAFEWPAKMIRHNKYRPLGALQHAANDVKMFTELNFIIIGKMFAGKMSLKSLGGPITIFQTAGMALNQGFIAFMSFLAFLSISIGIMNILPIPGLDGGHLLFQTIEAFIRRPIPQRWMNLFYRCGLAFILLIMIQALVNDVSRLWM